MSHGMESSPKTLAKVAAAGGWNALLSGLERGPCEIVLDPLRDGGLGVLVRRHDGSAGAYRVVLRAKRPALDRLDPTGDERLPGVSVLRDDSLQDELAEAVRAVAVVSYRPGRRIVVRVETTKGRDLFVKFLRPSAFRRACETSDRLSDEGQVRFARPLTTWPDACALITRQCTGQSLWDRPDLHTMAHVRGSLDALAAVDAAPLRRHDAGDEKRATLRFMARSEPWMPALGDLRQMLEETDLGPAPQEGFVHRDLHEKQIFVDGTRWTLIDWEGASVGDVRTDQINLEEHFRLRRLRPHEPSDDMSGTHTAWRAMVRARLAAVYVRRPGWEWMAGRLAYESRQLLRAVLT